MPDSGVATVKPEWEFGDGLGAYVDDGCLVFVVNYSHSEDPADNPEWRRMTHLPSVALDWVISMRARGMLTV